MKKLLIVAACVMLAGCASDPGNLSSMKPVCDALIGPIRYTTAKKESLRYSGKVLAGDLKQRNAVGINLGCPAYKK